MAEILKTFRMNVDLTRSLTYDEFELVEGDNGNVILIELTDNGVPVDLTDAIVRPTFAHSKMTYQQDSSVPDGGVTVGTGSGKNEITIRLKSQSYNPKGSTLCELPIFSGDGHTTLVTTQYFAFTAHRAMTNDDTIQSQPQYPVILALAEQYNALLAREQANWSESDSSKPTFILNKPVIGTDIQPPTNSLTVDYNLVGTDVFPLFRTAVGHVKATLSAILGFCRTYIIGSVTGILKGDGAGNVSQAIPNTDYAAATHASRHASGAADALAPSAIGAPYLSEGVVSASQARCLVQTKTASFTLGSSDAEKLTLLNSTSAIVVTLPNDSTYNFPIGTAFNFIRWNSGAAAFMIESGVGWVAVNNVTSISTSGCAATVVKVGTNMWWLICG